MLLTDTIDDVLHHELEDELTRSTVDVVEYDDVVADAVEQFGSPELQDEILPDGSLNLRRHLGIGNTCPVDCWPPHPEGAAGAVGFLRIRVDTEVRCEYDHRLGKI